MKHKNPKRTFEPTEGHVVVERYAAKQAGLIVLPDNVEPRNEWYVVAVNDPLRVLEVGDVVTVDSQKLLAIFDGRYFFKTDDVLAVHGNFERDEA